MAKYIPNIASSPDGPIQQCRTCRAWYPTAEFYTKSGMVKYDCRSCRRQCNAMVSNPSAKAAMEAGMRAKLEEILTAEPKPRGLPTLHNRSKRQPRFAHLPEHLRPRAEELFQQFMAKHPDAVTNAKKRALLIALAIRWTLYDIKEHYRKIRAKAKRRNQLLTYFGFQPSFNSKAAYRKSLKAELAEYQRKLQDG